MTDFVATVLRRSTRACGKEIRDHNSSRSKVGSAPILADFGVAAMDILVSCA